MVTLAATMNAQDSKSQVKVTGRESYLVKSMFILPAEEETPIRKLDWRSKELNVHTNRLPILYQASETPLSLHPSILQFARPLQKRHTQLCTLLNNASLPVLFKVKTTAQKVRNHNYTSVYSNYDSQMYCVHPNHGYIEPGKSFDVLFVKEPMSEEPPASAVCADRFMVVSTAFGLEGPPGDNVRSCASPTSHNLHITSSGTRLLI